MTSSSFIQTDTALNLGTLAEGFHFNPNPRAASDEQRAEILANPAFGSQFTDHMALISWTKDAGWHSPRVEAFAPLSLNPAAAIFHYAQGVFEGLKAYRWEDGSIWTFRPQLNAERFNRSALRLALPRIDVELFLTSLKALVSVDVNWVPNDGKSSLYLRPFAIATEPQLAVRPSNSVEYLLIASVAGDYFKNGVKPIAVWVSEDYTRAARGGTGEAKCGGNYAASMLAQQQAAENGCDQVIFLDAAEGRWVEELGGMNIFFVLDDGTIVTPELTGTLLAGVTRQSVITLAQDLGHEVVERRIDISELQDGLSSSRIREVFACGTAAVVTPIGQFVGVSGKSLVNGEGPGPVTTTIRQMLIDLQFGRVSDPHSWMHQLL